MLLGCFVFSCQAVYSLKYVSFNQQCDVCCVCPYSADEAQRRDVVRAAGPPQRAVEERGAGMPRRRRNLASMVANRQPQRVAVEPGKYHLTITCKNCNAKKRNQSISAGSHALISKESFVLTRFFNGFVDFRFYTTVMHTFTSENR